MGATYPEGDYSMVSILLLVEKIRRNYIDLKQGFCLISSADPLPINSCQSMLELEVPCGWGIPSLDSPGVPFPAQDADGSCTQLQQLSASGTQSQPRSSQCPEDVAMGKQGNIPFPWDG